MIALPYSGPISHLGQICFNLGRIHGELNELCAGAQLYSDAQIPDFVRELQALINAAVELWYLQATETLDGQVLAELVLLNERITLLYKKHLADMALLRLKPKGKR